MSVHQLQRTPKDLAQARRPAYHPRAVTVHRTTARARNSSRTSEPLWGHAVGFRILLAVAFAGCTAAIDLEALEDGVCESGFKACDETCVPTDNPLFGCEAQSCAPCAIPNATGVCSPDGVCEVAVCDPNFADCTPGDSDNGCLVDLAHDPLNCGECGSACELDNAKPLCANRRCAIGVCDEGWGDCDDTDANGCEADLTTDVAHCGACDEPCDDSEQCVDGICTI